MNQQNKREHWANILEKQQQSGFSIKQFCLNNNISYQTFYYWSKKLNQPEPKTQVQPIVVSELAESCINCVVLRFINRLRLYLHYLSLTHYAKTKKGPRVFQRRSSVYQR